MITALAVMLQGGCSPQLLSVVVARTWQCSFNLALLTVNLYRIQGWRPHTEEHVCYCGKNSNKTTKQRPTSVSDY